MTLDMVVMRHSASGRAAISSRATARSSVINAGDGTHEHPTQALLDLFTIREHGKGARRAERRHRRRHPPQPRRPLGHLRPDASSAPAGHGRAARPRSRPRGIEALRRAGAPRVSRRRSTAPTSSTAAHADRAAAGATSCRRCASTSRLFGVTTARLKLAKPDAIVMHPGPMNRGVEITPRGGRRRAVGHPRPGHQRRRRAHGRALPAGRRQLKGPTMKRNGSLLIRGGRVVDPSPDLDEKADVLIRDGRIAHVGKGIRARRRGRARRLGRRRRARIHRHARAPARAGCEDKEDIETGTRAAAARRLHAVACMPNTDPVTDTCGCHRPHHERADAVAAVASTPSARSPRASGRGARRDRRARRGRRRGRLATTATASQDSCVHAPRPRVRQHVRRARHRALRGPGARRRRRHARGHSRRVLGLTGIPSAAEEVMVARDIIARRADRRAARTSPTSPPPARCASIREAKARGVPVTAEVTPHHFTLTDDVPRTLRHQLQDEPAAAQRGGPARAPRGAARRHASTASPPTTRRTPTTRRRSSSRSPPSASSGSRPPCRSRCTSWCDKHVLTLAQLVEKWPPRRPASSSSGQGLAQAGQRRPT